MAGWISCTSFNPKTASKQSDRRVSSDLDDNNISHQYDTKDTIYLAQNWTPEQRQFVYFTPQGSYIMNYDWALKLKRFDDGKNFFTSENLQRYGYVPQKRSPENPDGLPVGFTKDGLPNNPAVGAKLGVTCAACHTADITYRGQRVRVDGGQSFSDFQTFISEMDKSIFATQEDSSKLKSFLDDILGEEKDNQEKRSQVQAQFDAFVSERKQWKERNDSKIDHGYGRTDAVGVILNQVTAWDMKNPKSAASPDAPVSFPFIWNASQLEIAQYIPLSRNAERGGPLARNVGEVLGVFGVVDIFSRTKILNGVCSSVKRDNLEKLEEKIGKLWSPNWPENIFGQFQQVSVNIEDKPYFPNLKNGASLYQTNCMGCHAVLPSYDTSTPIKAHFIDAAKVGTDMELINRGVVRIADTGPFKNQLSDVVEGFPMSEAEPAAVLLRFAVVSTILGTDSRLQCGVTDGTTWKKSIERYKTIFAKVWENRKKPKAATPIVDRDTRIKNMIVDYSKYKARPLNGIWSTAPFLHNGSVKSLYELLQSPELRSKKFTLGCTEFDPVNVGIDCDSSTGQASAETRELKVFDTTVKGNSNAGHLYGTQLSEYEKRDLLEYLKTL
ncbi:MAG: di-heme-cytochrome C peroxidase [Bdellovibrio sp.]